MTTTNNDKSIVTATHENEVVIRLSGISKKYNLYNKKQDRLKEALDPRRKEYHHEFYALKDINLEVRQGEILGIVGKNGSGKSTLLTIIARILTPTVGVVEVKGNIVPLLELGAGFNPQFTGVENIYFYCSLLGYTRKQTDEIFDGIINFAELGDYIYQPIKTYSSGMRARLAFAVSVNVDPDILILDEVLAVGDELFKRKCYARMEEFFEGGKTILFVSHDTNAINRLCTRAVLLDKGEQILDGPAKLVTMHYQKMLYAAKGKENQVRAEIIELNKNKSFKQESYREAAEFKKDVKKQISNNNRYDGDEVAPDEQNIKPIDHIVKQKAYYIPGMKPKSTVEYRNYDVDISDVKITTENGETVNNLKNGERYFVNARLYFKQEFKDLAAGMHIINEKGVAIGSVESIKLSKNGLSIDEVNENIYIDLKYGFNCLLKSGNYFLHIGVSSFSSGEQVVLNRIKDAIVFKVFEDANSVTGGIVDIFDKNNLFFEKRLKQ